jgi:hypothetical protein
MPLWFFLIGCSSIDLPTVEQSEAAIQRLREDIEHAERPLRIFERRFEGSRDAVSIVRANVVNRLLAAVASQRSDDIIIAFSPTRPLLSERKSILGIQYTNYLDIDSGRVSVNLRRAELVSTRRNVLRVFLHIEGGGRIAASGRYTGIPAHASPRIELSLRDTISLELSVGKNGTILLVPQRREALLHATLYVNLAGWELPWKEDIPLRVDELLTPMELPGLISTTIKLPVPAREYSDRNYEFIDVPFLINDPVLFLEGQRIVYTFDCDFPRVAAPLP